MTSRSNTLNKATHLDLFLAVLSSLFLGQWLVRRPKNERWRDEPCPSDPLLGRGFLNGVLRTDLVHKIEQFLQLNHLSGLFFSHRLELFEILLLQQLAEALKRVLGDRVWKTSFLTSRPVSRCPSHGGSDASDGE